MKYCQLIEYKKWNIFFKNHAENETWKIVPGLFFCFWKAFYEVKASGVQPNFDRFQLAMQ